MAVHMWAPMERAERPSRAEILRKQIQFRAEMRKIRSAQRQELHLQAVSDERRKVQA